uniref:Late embryogenesis abundant protein LEA-2 subgroup domain-containing protein n=1 Tax=Fagus sylvatica TaxID=28930 RepID=A0A2N9J8C8_FAGSY
MEMIRRFSLLIILLLFVSSATAISSNKETKTCYNRKSKCFLKKITCPAECPTSSSKDPKAKVCYVNCDSPICKAACKRRKPNCNAPGAGCYDPRFIGGDGIVFYFHGKSNEQFTLVSDLNLQINARFTGLRPAGRTRDYTWIQALGLLFDTKTFSLEAITAATWDNEVDHLKFSYNGNDLFIPEGHRSSWKSPENDIVVERTSDKNSVIVTLPEVAEISVNVVPVTKEDDRIHNYQIPSHDCFAHLEVQFRFYGLSSKVEGVLGRTYQPDFKNPAKPGVAMPVVGGEDKYRTTSLLSADCSSCVFSPAGVLDKKDSLVMEYGMLDCTGGATGGNGIVCRK